MSVTFCCLLVWSSSRTKGNTHTHTHCHLSLIKPEAVRLILITFLPFKSHSNRKMSPVAAVNGVNPGRPLPPFDGEHLKEAIVAGSSMGCFKAPLKRRERKTEKNKPQMSRNTRPSGVASFLILISSLFQFRQLTHPSGLRPELLRRSEEPFLHSNSLSPPVG